MKTGLMLGEPDEPEKGTPMSEILDSVPDNLSDSMASESGLANLVDMGKEHFGYVEEILDDVAHGEYGEAFDKLVAELKELSAELGIEDVGDSAKHAVDFVKDGAEKVMNAGGGAIDQVKDAAENFVDESDLPLSERVRDIGENFSEGLDGSFQMD